MSQPTLSDLRTAIQQNIATGLPGFQGQILPYWLANPTAPCIDIKRGPIAYDTVNARGGDTVTMVVRAIYAFTADQAAQMHVDDLVSGTYTLKDAIESDKQLGGLVANVRVTGVSDEKAYVRDDGTSYLGAEWTLEILT